MVTATTFGLDVASLATTVGLDIAKISTKMGFFIASRSIDAASWLVAPKGDDEEENISASWTANPISAVLAIASNGVSFGETVTIGSMNVASTVATKSLETARDSIETLNTLFGTTDTARCLEEFVQLVRREWPVKEEERHLLPDKFSDFTITGSIKALTAWAAIQKLTNSHWETQVLESCSPIATFSQRVDVDDEDDNKTLCTTSSTQPSDATAPSKYDVEDEETMIVTHKEEVQQGTIFEGTIDHPSMASSGDVGTDYSERPRNAFQAVDGGRRGSWSYPFMEEATNTDELLRNLHRYSKFSIGAYGRGFMQMFGLTLPPLPVETTHLNPNHVTFAHYTSTAIENVIGFPNAQEPTSTNDSKYAPSYYLIKDHDSRSIILSFRGTFSLNDLAVDLTCEYDDFAIVGEKSDQYKVHSGIYRAAKAIYKDGSGPLITAVKQALVENDGYGLVLIGHSLGAAIASILTLMIASPDASATTVESGLPPFRSVKTYCLAAPCCMDLALSERSKKLITSVVYSYDVIARLSLGSIRDLRTVVAWLTQDGAENELSTSIITDALNANEATVNWLISLRAGIEARMKAEKLYPAGTVYWIRDHPEKDNEYRLYRVENLEKVLGSIIFGKTMINDHWPHRYEIVLSQLHQE
ncbi:hypothetical protein VKS41_003453 [Umbelopsis sp. WA50703]